MMMMNERTNERTGDDDDDDDNDDTGCVANARPSIAMTP